MSKSMQEGNSMFVPTEEFLMAVITLSRQPELETVRQWLHRQLTLQSSRNDTQQHDVLLRMGQGRAQCMGQILKLLTPEFASRALDTLRAKNTTTEEDTDNHTLLKTAFC